MAGGFEGVVGVLAPPIFARALRGRDELKKMSKWFRTPYTSSSDDREDRGRASGNVRRAAKARKRRVCFMRAIVIVKRKDQTETSSTERR